MDWMLLPYQRYAEFSGRSRRREYWMFALLGLLVYAFCGALMYAGGLGVALMASAGGRPDFAAASFGASFWFGLAVAVVFGLASLIPAIAVTIRRLHDRDLSGWWYLGTIVAGAIPILGTIASLAFLVVMCLDGTPGPNRFGPDPKSDRGASTFG
ncbi:MAG TPA: DUF805 domain-containing protein [Novosphingobium sp.]